jgi:hypothetical protein
MTGEHESRTTEYEPVFQKYDYFLSGESKAFLRTRVEKCMLCKMILEDDAKHGKLTDEPMMVSGGSLFPVNAKLGHLKLEKWIERMCRGGTVR